MRALTVRLVTSTVLVVAAAWAARTGGAHDLASAPWFVPTATSLLAVGLYSSTLGIDLVAARAHLRTVLLAVTVGVLAKAALVHAVMFVCFGDPASVVLAVAVAQIDPLSVAAAGRSTGLTAEGRSLLSAWASFDDPVTMLITLVLLQHLDGAAGAGPVAAVARTATGLALSALLVVVVVVLQVPLRRVGAAAPRAAAVGELLLVAAAGVVAVRHGLLVGLAGCGLVVRPALLRGVQGERLLGWATTGAFGAAVVMLGLVCAGGVDLVRGAVLGVAAYGAQVLVGSLLTARLPRDRLVLALAQQNGITAVLLSLVAAPVVPAAPGVVAPAVLVVNTLHLLANGVAARYRGDGPAPAAPAPAAPVPPAR